MLANGEQAGNSPATDTPLVLLLLAALLAVGVVLWVLHSRRNRRPRKVEDEWRARALMGELCPHGWQVQITLFGWHGPAPADAPSARAPLVELDWRHYDETGAAAGGGRCWAPSVAAGLKIMVDSRWEELEREALERSVTAED